MNTPHTLKKMIAGALLSGGFAIAALGLGAGPAHAYTYGPFQWCPGQAMPNDPPRPDGELVWEVLVKQLGHRPSEASQLIADALKRRPGVDSAEALFDESYRGAPAAARP